VQFARPSIDVMFESAAGAYGEATIGIVLTDANEDGAEGDCAHQGPGRGRDRQDPGGRPEACDADGGEGGDGRRTRS